MYLLGKCTFTWGKEVCTSCNYADCARYSSSILRVFHVSTNAKFICTGMEKKKFHEDTKKYLRADIVTSVSKEIKTWLKGRCWNIVVKEATFDHIDTDVIKRFGIRLCVKEVKCVTSPECNPYAVVTIGLIIYDSFVLVCFSGQPDF